MLKVSKNKTKFEEKNYDGKNRNLLKYFKIFHFGH